MASVAGTAQSVWYVYGFVPASLSPAAMPVGIDDAAVALERRNGVAALVSQLDAEQYAPTALETSSGDVEWLSPRAVAHDRVLTWASDQGPVIPLPMFTLFSSRDAVHEVLHDREQPLAATLERVGAGGAREYALRVYRVDAELMDAVVELSPRLAEMSAAAAAAAPGQRYLLERKLEGEKKAEIRGASQRLVESFVNDLSGLAREVVRSPIPRATTADTAARGAMVLNAAFLLAADQLEPFQRTLTSLVEQFGARGFRFDFTGPWPPYHFVAEAGHGA